MNIIGYRGKPTKAQTTKIFQKHTTLSQAEISKLVTDVLKGECVHLDNDWVLREDLEDSGFILD